MPAGSKIRPLARLLDASDHRIWAIDDAGRLQYVSAAVARWVGVDDPDDLIGRRSAGGVTSPAGDKDRVETAETAEPLDRIAAGLSPPPGLIDGGWVNARVTPLGTGDRAPASVEIQFVQLCNAVIAIERGGAEGPRDEIDDAVEVRQILQAYRKSNGDRLTAVLSGDSNAAKQLRSRIKLALHADDLLIQSPPGGPGLWIAKWIAARQSPHQPVVVVDCPLMDCELLDATIGLALSNLQQDQNARCTIVLDGLDEMPADVQMHLYHHRQSVLNRMHWIAVTDRSASPAAVESAGRGGKPPPADAASSQTPSADENPTHQLALNAPVLAREILPELATPLSTLIVEVTPIRERVTDLPLLAAAILDHLTSELSTPAADVRWSREAMDTLVLYPWPNDVTELLEVAVYALARCPTGRILKQHLPLVVRSFRPQPIPITELEMPLDSSVRRLEAELIAKALKASDGNRASAARLLDISRPRLLRKIDELTEAGLLDP